MTAPAVNDPRGRDQAVRELLASALERSTSAEDVAVAIRVLEAVRGALQVDVDRLMREIPSDGRGNPLPSGEAERRLWSAANTELERLEVMLHEILNANARLLVTGRR